jgi:hypothetical protein
MPESVMSMPQVTYGVSEHPKEITAANAMDINRLRFIVTSCLSVEIMIITEIIISH